jgi:hypothetical protein
MKTKTTRCDWRPARCAPPTSWTEEQAGSGEPWPVHSAVMVMKLGGGKSACTTSAWVPRTEDLTGAAWAENGKLESGKQQRGERPIAQRRNQNGSSKSMRKNRNLGNGPWGELKTENRRPNTMHKQLKIAQIQRRHKEKIGQHNRRSKTQNFH